MYTKMIPFKNFRDKPRNKEVQFNLTVHETLKLLVEFQAIFKWQEELEKRDPEAETDTAEVIEFYNNFEDIILAAWGEMDESGDHFRKGGVYDFRESALFHHTMELFLKDQAELNRFLNAIMPEGLQDVVKAADANLAELAKNGDNEAVNAEVARLQAELRAAQAQGSETSQ